MTPIKAFVFVDTPKTNPLQKILGLTLIERSIYALDRSGIKEIVLYTSTSSTALEKLLAQHMDWKAAVRIAPMKEKMAFFQKERNKKVENLLVMTEPIVVQTTYIQSFIQEGLNQSEKPLSNQNQTLLFFNTNTYLSTAPIALSDFKQLDTKPFLPNQSYICQTIHSKTDLKAVKKALMKSLIKPTDGWVSRNINRKISTTISRVLANTAIHPNHISIGTMLIGLVTGYYLAKGGYFYFLVGATLFQATSVLDGVDGELARLRFQQSDFGQWLDTIADNLTYVAALVGIIIGVYTNDSPSYIIWAGYIGLGVVLLTLASQYLYLIRFNSGGSLLNIPYNFKKGETTFDKIMQHAEVFGRRDFFAFVFFIFGILGIMPFTLVYVSLMVTIVLGFSIQAHFTAAKKLRVEN